MLLMSVAMFVVLFCVLTRTRIGLIIQAVAHASAHGGALGHNVPRVFMLVFGGGSALAGLAGVIGGHALVTQPGMAAALGPILFVVVVVGGLGSLAGAFIASLLIGIVQTFAVALDCSLADAFRRSASRRDRARALTTSATSRSRRSRRCCPICCWC